MSAVAPQLCLCPSALPCLKLDSPLPPCLLAGLCQKHCPPPPLALVGTALYPIAWSYVLFLPVQVAHVEAMGEYLSFRRRLARFWDMVKGDLELTLDDWKSMLDEEEDAQWQHLSNIPSPPMDVGRAKELAKGINNLVGISEWWRV